MSLLMVIAGLSLSGTVVLADSVASQPAPVLLTQAARQRGARPARETKILEQLNLSDTQQQQLESIRQKYQSQIRQSHEALRPAQQRLRSMMAGTNSEAAIRKQYETVARLRQQLDSLRFESMLEMRAVLTPDQRNQFAQLMQQSRGKSRARGSDRSQPDNWQP
jgi:Spy/CpxP family protein refolding chaperone